MHTLCPYCQHSVELAASTPEEILCTSCGSSFRMETAPSTRSVEPTAQKLGKYELLEVVGQGAFGTVYRGVDPELKRPVAIKVPRTGNLAGPQELERFLREARSVAQLRHPTIVTVHDVGQVDGVPYLVSEFVEGVTLADLLSARQLTPTQAATLAAAVAESLHYAHEHGVVHRDVKPSNIMLENPADLSTIRLMDFGLAKRDAHELTITIEKQVLGTPAYMSPEQARGDAHKVDGRTDVYSLGVILYQLLTGQLPFPGNTRMLLHQVLQDEPRPPRKLNNRIAPDLDTICMKCLEKQPTKRYANAKELAADLTRYLSGEPIVARRVGRGERAVRYLKRHPVRIGLLAGALLALGGIAVGYWSLREVWQAKQEVDQVRADASQSRQEAEKLRASLQEIIESTKVQKNQKVLEETLDTVKTLYNLSALPKATGEKIASDNSLTLEDKVIFMIMQILHQLDKDIEEQSKLVAKLEAAGSASVDVESMRLKRLIDQRSVGFDQMRQIIDIYNQTAKSIIDGLGR